MPRFILSLILLLGTHTGHSQLVPWYFQSPVFREWVRENKVASLTYQTPAIDGLGQCEKHYFVNEQRHVIAPPDNNDYCDRIGVNSFKYEYWFNENGFLDSVCVKSLDYHFASNEGSFMKVDDSLIDFFDKVIRRDFVPQFTFDTLGEYQHKLKIESAILKNCRFKSMSYFFDQTGSVWYTYQNQLPVPEFAGQVTLKYRVIQTIRYENGEPKTVRKYPYYGDFWSPAYTYFTREKRSDSLEHIAIRQPLWITEDYYYDIPVGDTVFHLSTFKEQKGSTTYFYTINEDHQLPDLNSLPNIERTQLTNGEIIRYRNVYYYSNDFRKWGFANSLFTVEGNFEELEHPARLEPVELAATRPNEVGKGLEFENHYKKGEWKKTEIYSLEQEGRTLLYTDTPYEFGIKRKKAVRYKQDANTVFFEHIGEHFRVYDYSPNAKKQYRIGVEIETKNGYLFFGGNHEDETTTSSKMKISYR